MTYWNDGDVTKQPRFLDVDAVAREFAVTKHQVYSLLKSGELPAIQIGPKRVWRIERSKIEDYIERQYAATRAAVERGEMTAIPEGNEA